MLAAEHTPGAACAALKNCADTLAARAGESNTAPAHALRIIARRIGAYGEALDMVEQEGDALSAAILLNDATYLIAALSDAADAGEAALVRLAQAIHEESEYVH